MTNFLLRIKNFFTKGQKNSFKQFFSKYLKIKTELAVSDIKVSDSELNFKVSWRGNTVPFWISSKYEVSEILPLIVAGLVFGLNLVEISQELKNYNE